MPARRLLAALALTLSLPLLAVACATAVVSRDDGETGAGGGALEAGSDGEVSTEDATDGKDADEVAEGSDGAETLDGADGKDSGDAPLDTEQMDLPIDLPPDSPPDLPPPQDAACDGEGGPPDGSTCCGDAQNTSQPPSSSCNSDALIAWQYTPTCTFEATKIELHALGGQVAVLEGDAGGKPGATLWQGTLSSSNNLTWVAADVVPPLPLEAGKLYFLAHKIVSQCSVAAAGTPFAYYSASTLNGPWNGPYSQWAWTSRLTGPCECN